ncbi:MAG: hypothetical protein H7257_10535 [Taibaiella sp.]|nr:hypothetical protein [Taibaiella sp.]
MKHTLPPAALFILMGNAATAQRQMGISTSRFNAQNSLYLNPANVAGCKEKFSILLFSTNLAVDNNLGTISSLGEITSSLNTDTGSTPSLFKYKDKSEFSMMLPMFEVRLPGLLYRINSRHTLAISTRVRVFNEFNNFSTKLYTTVIDPNTAAQQATTRISSKNFNWTAHVWGDIGLTYGAVAIDNEKLQVKAGVTLRYLGGAGYLGLKGNNLDISYTNGSDSFYAANSDIQFSSNASGADKAITNGVNFSDIFAGDNSGRGFGADIGVTVGFNPDGNASNGSNENSNTNYKIVASAAITDIGALTYSKASFVKLTGNGYMTGKGISDNVKSYEELRQYARQNGYSADTGVASTKVHLPTALILGVDYMIVNRLYANITYAGDMTNDRNFGSKLYSQVTITPRFDSRVLTIAVPFTYSMLSHSMRAGLGVKFSGFYAGSDDMMALFSNGQYGFNFYFGVMVPIYRKSK